jgi:hypothetical protein
MADERDRYAGLKHHARVHTFRFATMILAWALLIAAFLFDPRLIADVLRAFSHVVEHVADLLPERIGSYVEIGLRELGGLLWLQIAALIVVVRVVFWGIGQVLRRARR